METETVSTRSPTIDELKLIPAVAERLKLLEFYCTHVNACKHGALALLAGAQIAAVELNKAPQNIGLTIQMLDALRDAVTKMDAAATAPRFQ